MAHILMKCPPEVTLRPLAQMASSTSGSRSFSRNLQTLPVSASNTARKLRVNRTTSPAIFQRRFYKAALCTELGKPLTIGVKKSEELNAGEVRVQVSAVGVNFGDLLMLVGEYQVKLPLPFTPGSEMSGTVLEVADDVEGLKPGMRVVGILSSYGGYAEEVVTQADSLWTMPNSMSFKEAAGFVCSYGTAFMGLSRRAKLKSGETVLVTAAAGAVGLAAVDIASNVFGANVVGAAGSDEKCDLVKSYGAMNAINYRKDNVRDKMKSLCPEGANVVFDAVGGSIFKDALRSIAFEGRLLVIGFASGQIPQIPANHLLVKNVSAIGFYWGGYAVANLQTLRWSVDECLKHYESGKIKPHICETFDLSEINSAFDFVKSRKSTGKVVILIR